MNSFITVKLIFFNLSLDFQFDTKWYFQGLEDSMAVQVLISITKWAFDHCWGYLETSKAPRISRAAFVLEALPISWASGYWAFLLSNQHYWVLNLLRNVWEPHTSHIPHATRTHLIFSNYSPQPPLLIQFCSQSLRVFFLNFLFLYILQNIK